MRKLALGFAVLGAALALLGGAASAAQARSFTVIGVDQGDGHGDRNSYVFHQRLYADGEHVGRNRVEFSRTGRRSYSAKALFRFHRGKIRVAGPVTRGSHQTLPITGGKGRFHGISGALEVADTANDSARFTFRFSR